MADPIHQFEIHKIATLGHIGGHEIAFTNSALFMAITVVGIWALLVGGSSARALVPGRMQSIAELSYEFVADTINSTAGKEGMKFFPLVFTLFMFILVANIIGLIPYTFTVTSHIIITAALALLVFITVLVYGFTKNGLGFFRLFVPQGIPIYILPLIVFIEVLSFLSRPISHSVRLFANMLAGHITLKVFASFVTLCMALMVFLTMTIYGFYKHGLHFLKLFVPSGIPGYILPLVVFIEVLSYFLKPVSHSVRLFANMLAGHIALKVFAGFVAMLGVSLGALGWFGGMLPLALTVALTALELLVAFLQAYVFAILTCIYLNDAIHPGH